MGPELTFQRIAQLAETRASCTISVLLVIRFLSYVRKMSNAWATIVEIPDVLEIVTVLTIGRSAEMENVLTHADSENAVIASMASADIWNQMETAS